MAVSVWTWIGNSNTTTLSNNWQLISGPGNAGGSPLPGDTEIFNGTGVPPLFADAAISGITVDLNAAGALAFLNDTNVASTTSLDAASTIVAAGTATSIQINGTLDNAGTIQASGVGNVLAISIGAAGTFSGVLRNDGQIIVDPGDTLSIAGDNGGGQLLDFGGIQASGTLRSDAITLENAGGLTVTGAVAVGILSEDAGGTVAVNSGSLGVSGTAVIGQSGTGAILTLSGGAISAASLSVGLDAGGSGAVTVSGGQLGVSGTFRIGVQGNGIATINSGAALIAGNGIVIQAGGTEGAGTLINNGGLMIVTGSLMVGSGGAARAVVVAGAIVSMIGNAATDQLRVGAPASGGGASLLVDGAVITASNEAMTVGNGSVLINDAGTIATTSRATVPAVDINATGEAQAIVRVSDSGSAWNLNSSGSRFIVGDTGNGSVSVRAGGVVNAGSNTVEIGAQASGAGTVTVGPGGNLRAATPSATAAALDIAAAFGAAGALSVDGTNAALTATGQVIVGDGGFGNLTIADQAVAHTGGGTLTPSLGIDVGRQASGIGQVTVSGAGTHLFNDGGFIVGDAGLGGLSIQSGATVVTTPGTVSGLAGMLVGNAATSAGASVDVTGAGTELDVSGLLDVGVAGSGVLRLSGGATVTADLLDAANVAAAVGQIDLAGAGTTLKVTGDATVADDGTGVLSVLSGATFAASSLTIGSQGNSSGALVVSGNGSAVNLSGAINIGTALGTGDLTVGPGAAVHASVVNLQGQVVLEGGLLDPTVQVINQGQTTGGFGTIAADDIIDEGLIQAGGPKATQRLLLVQGTIVGGGTLTKNGTVLPSSPAGLIQINTGGTAELTGPVLNAASTSFQDALTPTNTYTITNSVVDVSFADAGGVLLLDDIAGFAGTITSFKAGDQFVITGGTLSAPSISNGNTLTFSDSGLNAGAGGIDRIIFGSPVNAGQFNVVNGNTMQAVACFAEGTRIETEVGPVTVEDLAVGERVVTADGRIEPVVWVGSRTVKCRRHPRPETVWPVRVKAGAFGANIPARDVYLSPDHAVFVNDLLVPVKLLINGASIVQERRSTFRYFHVELPQHEVILAEGLAVESYLDLGDRANFHDNETIRLFPDFATRLAPETAQMWEIHGAAPLVMMGEELAAAKAAVAASASHRDFRPIETFSTVRRRGNSA